jgi:hypothetical protein
LLTHAIHSSPDLKTYKKRKFSTPTKKIKKIKTIFKKEFAKGNYFI